jgi:osmotically-inducible protein OsmY
VRDAIVTLSGCVSSDAEKRAAEILAGRVAGVRAVIDDLLVAMPQQTEDELIATRCIGHLAADGSIELDRIHIAVTDGIVTIHGDVDNEWQRKRIEADLNTLEFLRGVVNEVVVTAPVQAELVRQKVRQALAPISAINAENIEVKAVGTHVVLKGTVNSWHQRQLAETAARSVPGVSSVDVQLEVQQ